MRFPAEPFLRLFSTQAQTLKTLTCLRVCPLANSLPSDCSGEHQEAGRMRLLFLNYIWSGGWRSLCFWRMLIANTSMAGAIRSQKMINKVSSKTSQRTPTPPPFALLYPPDSKTLLGVSTVVDNCSGNKQCEPKVLNFYNGPLSTRSSEKWQKQSCDLCYHGTPSPQWDPPRLLPSPAARAQASRLLSLLNWFTSFLPGFLLEPFPVSWDFHVRPPTFNLPPTLGLSCTVTSWLRHVLAPYRHSDYVSHL